MPGGALVDAARSERLVAGLAIIAIAIAALTYAAFPIFPAVLAAAVLARGGELRAWDPPSPPSALGLSGTPPSASGLAATPAFASIGNGLAAAAMGACGYFFSARAVFIVTALLLVPTLLALRRISRSEIDPERAHGGVAGTRHRKSRTARFPCLLRNRPLLIFAGCIMLFHLANAAMLPLMGSVLTTRSSEWATVLIAACIVVPQIVVAVISPWVGRQVAVLGPPALAAHRLRRAADPRAAVRDRDRSRISWLLCRLLDGLTAAVIGVMVPLIIADLTRGTGRFNLGQGIVGTMTGLGAAASTTLGGYMTRLLRQPGRVSRSRRDRRRRADRRRWLHAGNPARPSRNKSRLTGRLRGRSTGRRESTLQILMRQTLSPSPQASGAAPPLPSGCDRRAR